MHNRTLSDAYMEVARGGRGVAPTGTSNFQRPENYPNHTLPQRRNDYGKAFESS